MRYSKGFKMSVLKKVLPPVNRSVKQVSRETGVSETSIHAWIKMCKDGKIETDDSELRPLDRNPTEKFCLLLEGKSLKGGEQGAWLRENGLHTENLNQFEQELKDIVNDQNQKYKDETKKLRKENKALGRELSRKEKALAEMAALLTLKKKADRIWGGDVDD